MYLEHFQLNEYPFTISPDPKFLWRGEKYQEALANLEYGIIENKGFILLIGDVGAGKTMLLNTLLNGLSEEVLPLRVPDPSLTKKELLYFLANAFQIKGKFRNKGIFLNEFGKILEDIHAAGKKVLLVVDEAQRMTHELAEEIRILSNLEKQDVKLLNIILAGQNELGDFLCKDENRALRQRITVQYTILPLSPSETKDYLETRLRIAGVVRTIFNSGAIREIHAFSNGYPRLINTIADRALLTAYIRDLRDIDRRIIKECAAELNVPQYTKKNGLSSPIAASTASRAKRIALGTGVIIGLLIAAIVVMIVLSKRLADNLQTKSLPSPTIQPAPPQSLPTQTEAEAIDNAESYQGTSPRTGSNGVTDAKARQTPIAYREKFIFQINRPFPLSDQDQLQINRLCAFIKQHPGIKVKISGHTDSTGELAYNLRLSQTRADLIKDLMIKNGINQTDIEAVGMGPHHRLESNDTVAGRQKNRRVEIEIYSAVQIPRKTITADEDAARRP